MYLSNQESSHQGVELHDHLTDREVAKIFNISIRTLRNKICRGENLPRSYKPKGFRARIWMSSDVLAFIDKGK